jgi:hypothetical protein
MKIVDAESVKTTNSRGKKELNAIEKFLFDKENKKVRLATLMGLEEGKAGVVELSEIQGYGANKKSVRGIDTIMNKTFILAEIPLIARRADDTKIVIRKLNSFSLDNYSKGDKKPMSDNHIETVKAELAKVLA